MEHSITEGSFICGSPETVVRQIEKIASGSNFRKQREAGSGVERVFAELCVDPPDLVVASANGTFLDQGERAAVSRHCPDAKVYAMKQALGESVGASSLWQTICAVQSLQTQRVPSCSFGGDGIQVPLRTSLVSTCGLNQQVNGLRLRRAPAGG